MKRTIKVKAYKEVFQTLVLSSGVSLALLLIRILVSNNFKLSFLIWNLLLAWVPLVIAYILKFRLVKISKIDWKHITLGCVWLVFLPNSFYIITDLIHLQSSGEVSLLYDTAMVASFVINGLLLGYISLYIVHSLAKNFLGYSGAYIFAQVALLLSSFAIYLGRYLRWNTWDVIINPIGLIFDVSDRIINPGSYLLTFVITGVFYILLGSTYSVIYRLIEIVSVTKK